jgi:hypothetical protein
MPIDESLIEEMTREFFNGQYPYVKVVPRLEATDKTSFARGATLFAKVKEKYIAHLTRGTDHLTNAYPAIWQRNPSCRACPTKLHKRSSPRNFTCARICCVGSIRTLASITPGNRSSSPMSTQWRCTTVAIPSKRRRRFAIADFCDVRGAKLFSLCRQSQLGPDVGRARLSISFDEAVAGYSFQCAAHSGRLFPLTQRVRQHVPLRGSVENPQDCFEPG